MNTPPTTPEIDLSAIAANAIENAEWWLDSASVKLTNGNYDHDPAIIAGFMIAAAISYHADRQVDAAEMIASAILKASGKGGGNG